MSGRGGAFFTGLVVGALAGSAAGMLLAPRGGAETRQALREWIPETGVFSREMLQQVGDELRRRLESGRSAFVEGKEQARVQLERELQRARGVPT